MTTPDTIGVVCLDLTCFKVRADTLDPIGGTYYEPAALSDPRGPQMDVLEWTCRRNAQLRERMKAGQVGLDTC